MTGWMDQFKALEATSNASVIELVWAAYGETGWPEAYGEPPTATEWKALRRWARTWIRRQDDLKKEADSRWPILDGLPTSRI